MIRADLHLHTCHGHGQDTVAAMYAAGREKGLEFIGFSEHSPRPSGYDYPNDYRVRLEAGYPGYVAQVEALREQDPGVLLGLEMDWLPDRRDFMAATVGRYPYDYIIAGLHFHGAWGFDFHADDWAGMGEAECSRHYEAYYAAMSEMAASGLFHIVAHPDLIKIFSVERFRRWLASARGQDCVRAALEALRGADLALEISSAGLRKPCGEIYPAPALVGLAAELGLAVSFGSDAHCANTPAHAFEQLAEYARGFGYVQSACFRRGERFFLPF